MARILLALPMILMVALFNNQVLANGPQICSYTVTNCVDNKEGAKFYAESTNGSDEVRAVQYAGDSGQIVKLGCAEEKCDTRVSVSWQRVVRLGKRIEYTAYYPDACEDLWVTGGVESRKIDFKTTPACDGN